MKNIMLIAIVALFCISALCDECWSENFHFYGIINPEEELLLNPSDELAYSSALVEGEPVWLTITAKDNDNSWLKVTLFSSSSNEFAEGKTCWDYQSEEYKGIPLNDTYTLSEKVVSDTGSKIFSRTITLLPEPCFIFIFCLLVVSFLRRSLKSTLVVLALAALGVSNLRAEGIVSNVNCLQMWPFDSSVIINYTLSIDKAFPTFEVKFLGSTDNGKTTFDLSEKGTISGDGAEGTVDGSGGHKTIWVPDESFCDTPFESMKIKVEAIDKSEYGKKPYMVIDLSEGTNATNYSVTYLDDVPEGGWTEEYKTTKMVLRLIPAGTFTMGSPYGELGRSSDETQHEVTFADSFYIGVFEVTQKQYWLITGLDPSKYRGVDMPVQNVSYDNIRGNGDKGLEWPLNNEVDEDTFLSKLRSRTNLPFDLPSEAQWEYACRAETTTALNSGKNLTDAQECSNLKSVGCYLYNAEKAYGTYGPTKPKSVGSYRPNAWGLYDMHGNVLEWCLDWYKGNLGSDSATDPLGPDWGQKRVLRGGSCEQTAKDCRSASRECYLSYNAYRWVGFRVALSQYVFPNPDEKIKKTFEYEIQSEEENTLPVFQTKFYGKLKDGTELLLEETGTLEEDGASGIVLGNGKHSITWSPYDAYTNLIDELEIRVECEDVTSNATYLVLDLPSNKMRTSLDGPDVNSNKCRTDELWLRRIEPGIFTMGNPYSSEGDAYHEVTLTKAFYIGIFEITQEQTKLITGANPSMYLGSARPFDCANYNMIRGLHKGIEWPLSRDVDDISFLGKLRRKAGNIFDLPTEAQWEYACRAGTTTDFNNGRKLTGDYGCTNLNLIGRYSQNKQDGKGGYAEHATVGSYLPNAWGLYDMHGNVYELCLDIPYAFTHDPETDPVGANPAPNSGSYREVRGGSWGAYAKECRSYIRKEASESTYGSTFDGYYGFRVVIVP